MNYLHCKCGAFNYKRNGQDIVCSNCSFPIKEQERSVFIDSKNKNVVEYFTKLGIDIGVEAIKLGSSEIFKIAMPWVLPFTITALGYVLKNSADSLFEVIKNKYINENQYYRQVANIFDKELNYILKEGENKDTSYFCFKNYHIYCSLHFEEVLLYLIDNELSTDIYSDEAISAIISDSFKYPGCSDKKVLNNVLNVASILRKNFERKILNDIVIGQRWILEKILINTEIIKLRQTATTQIVDNSRFYEEDILLYKKLGWLKSILSKNNIDIEYINDYLFCNNLSWQLINCMNETNNLYFNMDGKTISQEESLRISLDIINKCLEKLNDTFKINCFVQILIEVLKKDEVKSWIEIFKEELLKDRYDNIKTYILIERNTQLNGVHDMQCSYMTRFALPVIKNGKTCLSLHDVYVPHYCYIDGYIEYKNKTIDDILYNFCINDNFSVLKYIKEDNNTDSIRTEILILKGEQGKGKTTILYNLLTRYYSNPQQNYNKIHLISFSNSSLKSIDLTPIAICKYLNTDLESLRFGILIIENFEKSGLTQNEAIEAIKSLRNMLYEYDCKILILSRPVYSFSELTNDERIFDVCIDPFSERNIRDWLEKYWMKDKLSMFNNNDSIKCHLKKCDKHIDEISKQIQTLSPENKEVVFTPNIFVSAVKNEIPLGDIHSTAQLYDLQFGRNKGLVYDVYMNTYGEQGYNLKEIRKIISEISVEYIRNKNPFFIPNIVVNERSDKFEKYASDYYLMRLDNDKYTFTHDSVAHYFAAKKLYDILIDGFDKKKYDLLIENIINSGFKSFTLTDDLIDMLSYFMENDSRNYTEQIKELVKFTLSSDFPSELIKSQNISEYYLIYYTLIINFIKIMTVILIAKNDVFIKDDFFNNLSTDEINRFIFLSRLYPFDHQIEWSKCLNPYILDRLNLSGINLMKSNLRGKAMRGVTLNNCLFSNAELSGAYMLNSDCIGSCFDKATCNNMDFTDSRLTASSFRLSALNGADFTNAILDGADFRKAKLKKCNFAMCSSMIGIKISVSSLRDILYGKYRLEIDDIKNNNFELYDENDERITTDIDAIIKQNAGAIYAIYEHKNRRL